MTTDAPGGSRPAPWRDHEDRPVDAPDLPEAGGAAFYPAIGAFQGTAYARNAFARGTAEETAALRSLLPLAPGRRLLDVGCGDGRHARRLAAQGLLVTALDVAPALIEAGRRAAGEEGARVDWRVGDARRLDRLLGPVWGTYDVAWSLCQGALGTSPATDRDVVRGMAGAVVPGGHVALTFFHALFAVRHLVPGDAFDPVGLVHHHRAEVRGPDDRRATFDLWTSAYTVREATDLAVGCGLEVLDVRGVEPGSYGRRGPGEVGLDDPELLLIARRPPD